MTSKGCGTPDHLAQLGLVHGTGTHHTKCVQDRPAQPLEHAWTPEIIGNIISRQIPIVEMDLPSLCENFPSRCEGDKEGSTRAKNNVRQGKGMAGQTAPGRKRG